LSFGENDDMKEDLPIGNVVGKYAHEENLKRATNAIISNCLGNERPVKGEINWNYL